jgi:preprotein translocase subunit SecD
MKKIIVLVCSLATLLGVAAGKPPLRISDDDGENSTLLIVRDYSYTVNEKERGIDFHFGSADARKLTAISRNYVGRHLGIAVGGHKVSSPTLLDPLTGDGISVTFPDHQSLERMENALRGGK